MWGPFVGYIENGGCEIKVLCLDAARFIGEILARSAGVVAMSATLEPFDFYRNLLGFESQVTDEVSVPSPFPASHRLVLTLADVDTTYRQRQAHYDGIASWIEGDLSPGDRVVVIDDVATTGGSTIKAIERAREEGLEVERAVVLVDRQEGGLDNIRKHVPDVRAIVTRDELLEVFSK